MYTDVIWQAFAETGDPVLYLLYQAVTRGDECKKEKTTARDKAVVG